MKMTKKLNKIGFSLSVFYLLAVMGCALTASRTHPQFESRIRGIKDPVLIPPDLNMYELSPGGGAILRSDWSTIGRDNLQKAILAGFKNKQCRVAFLKKDAGITDEMADVQALYRLVNRSLQRHTFGPRQSTDKNHAFDYSLGTLDTILQKLGADAVIFVSGYDQVSEGRRKALIDLAIADASGTILYYSVKGTKEGNDLRDPESAVVVVQALLSSLSKAGG